MELPFVDGNGVVKKPKIQVCFLWYQIEFLSLFFSLFLHIGKITSVSFFVFSVVYFCCLVHNLSQHFICWLFHACQAIAI